ncbi:MAG: gluconeogenesis factor YvcK family protein [Actinomycetota bacterium]
MKVTGIGGGHGLSATLQAARRYASEVRAVVTVADDGGSSGQLSRELGIPPPGDLRNCLVALSDDADLTELFQHRFGTGALTGHTVGNLLIAALADMTGDFAAAVEEAGRLIGAKGEVLPATTELVTLRARVQGRVVRGQAAVTQTAAPIQAVYLLPARPSAYPPAVDAIMSADQVILGPGSLFTSLIATLLVPGIKDALSATRARRVFVCNAREQKGETMGLSASAHLEALLAHAGHDPVDAVVVQDPELPSEGVRIDRDALELMGVSVVAADVAGADGSHDATRLADVLASLV